jgi:hypothetical protein
LILWGAHIFRWSRHIPERIALVCAGEVVSAAREVALGAHVGWRGCSIIGSREVRRGRIEAATCEQQQKHRCPDA